MDWQPWLRFAHILGAFTFVFAHGVSAFSAIKLRGERDPARVTALLDLSKLSLPVTDGAILLLLVTGIAGGFVGGYWGHLWIWLAIGVLVFLFAFMSVRGVRHHDALRHALGMAGFYDHKGAVIPDADPDALARELDSPRALELAAVGGIGLVVILYLMVFKPF
jgi:hypothetical protein